MIVFVSFLWFDEFSFMELLFIFFFRIFRDDCFLLELSRDVFSGNKEERDFLRLFFLTKNVK